jgi:Neurotransmitter-gated ion-channel ligand binding domain/Lectin C-type domain
MLPKVIISFVGGKCMTPAPDFYILPFTRSFKKAMFTCQSLRASLYIANSTAKINEIQSNIILAKKTGLMWSGYRFNDTTRFFESVIDQSRLPDNVANWEWGEPNGAMKGYEMCLALDLTTWLLSDVDCELKLLTICDFTNSGPITTLHFRGVNNVTNFLDDQYVFITGQDSYFKGLSYTQIVYEQGYWIVKNSTNDKQLGNCSLDSEFPLGACNWTFIDGTTSTLNLNACLDSEYACFDSQCLSQEKRCNQIQDCTFVHSDEEGCNAVKLPENYNRLIPPDTSDFSVTVSINIFGLLNLDVTGNLFTVKFKVNTSWTDNRLTMTNLMDDPSENSIDPDERSTIWMPLLYFENSKESVLSSSLSSDAESTVYIERNSIPLSNDRGTLQQDFTFLGANQTIKKLCVYTVEFICEYDTTWYPFDTTLCNMNISVIASSQKISINPGNFSFTTDPGIGYFNMSNFTGSLTAKNMILGLQFERQVEPTLMSTILPTLILTLINQFTNYYLGPEMFEAIVTMNATVLMTLSSIFISYFTNLPSTNSTR